jgi:hypothetical protein
MILGSIGRAIGSRLPNQIVMAEQETHDTDGGKVPGTHNVTACLQKALSVEIDSFGATRVIAAFADVAK